MNIIKDYSRNKGSRNGWKPDMIVCHITDGTYSGSISWLKNPISFASANYIIAKDGRITELVPIIDCAWAQGLSKGSISKALLHTVRERGVNPNLYCISIEFEGFYKETHGAITGEQENAAVELIKYICDEVKRIYGINIPVDRQHIVGHCEINPIGKPNCPGEKFPFDEIISKLTSKPVQAPAIVQLPKGMNLHRNVNNSYVKLMQEKLKALGYYVGNGATLDGNFGPLTEKAVKAFQKAKGLETDGRCGPITWGALFN